MLLLEKLALKNLARSDELLSAAASPAGTRSRILCVHASVGMFECALGMFFNFSDCTLKSWYVKFVTRYSDFSV